MLNSRYITKDRPFSDDAERSSLNSFIIKSGDGKLFAVCGKPGGKKNEKHPAVLMMHGFPGLEQNRDLARALCRVGMTVFIFHYRGSWGSPGEYRLSHLPQDASAVLSYMIEHAEELSIDTDRIYLFGHSMGGFAAMNLLAERPKVKGAILMSPCDIEKMFLYDRANFNDLTEDGASMLNVPSAQVFEEECQQNKESWMFEDLAKQIDPAIHTLLLTASRDTILPPEEYGVPLLKSLQSAGIHTEYYQIDTDHVYMSHRIKMIRLVVEWIAKQESNANNSEDHHS